MMLFELQLFAAPTFTLFERNGASGGTLTASVPQIAYASVDSASSGTLSTANPIPQNSNSFEKYNGLQVASVATNAISALSAYFSATAPVDSGSTTLPVKFGVTATYTQPVSTASTVATAAISTDTSAPGTTMTPPANSVGSNSSYLVTQVQATSSQAGGNATFPSPYLVFQYTWS